MVYLLGWFFVYLSGLVQCVSKYRGRFFGFILVSFLSFLVIFRGDVGTDTNTYEGMIDAFSGVFSSVEVGYSSIVFLLKGFDLDSAVVLRIIGLVFCILFLSVYFFSNEDERFFVLYYFIPVFFYIYGMNLVRLGIASLLFFFSIRLYSSSKRLLAFLFFILSLSFHYSIFFNFIVFYLIFLKVINFRFFLAISFFILLAYFTVGDYLISKLNLYAESQSPSGFSGAGIVVAVVLFIAASVSSELSRVIKIRFAFFSFSLCLLSFFIALHSYAGLRLLNLLSFSLPVTLLVLHRYHCVRLTIGAKFFIFLAGFFSIILIFRNFLNEPKGLSSFLPYHFIF